MATSQNPDISCVDDAEMNDIMPSKPIKNLMQLNDYCLDEILRHLPVDELNNVASTCKHFKALARNAFVKMHQSDWLKLVVGTTEKRHEFDSPEQLYIAQILNNFGDILSKLNVSFNYSGADNHPDLSTKILNLIIRRCTGSVDHLILHCCRPKTEELIDPLPFFRNMKVLEFHYGGITNGAYLAECKNLTRLFLSCDIVDFLTNNYPKLESFTLTCELGADDIEKTQEKLNDFLRRHPNLKDIEFDSGEYCDLAIVGQLKHLERLYIYDPYVGDGDENIMPLAQLKQLKTLKLSIGGDMMAEFLSDLRSANTLEHLDLWDWGFDNEYNTFVTNLGRFRKLKVLKFNGADHFKDEHFVNLQHMKELRVLYLRNPQHITADGLVELVTNLKKLKELVLWQMNSNAQLQRCTYQRLADACHGRGHKLVIKNYEEVKTDGVVQFTNDGFCNVVEYWELNNAGMDSIKI